MTCVCVWFSPFSPRLVHLFARFMTFFDGSQNLYTQIRLRTVNREGFQRWSKRKAEQIMKLTMDEFRLAVSVSHCHCWLLNRAIFVITCQNVCGEKDWCIIVFIWIRDINQSEQLWGNKANSSWCFLTAWIQKVRKHHRTHSNKLQSYQIIKEHVRCSFLLKTQ